MLFTYWIDINVERRQHAWVARLGGKEVLLYTVGRNAKWYNPYKENLVISKFTF